MPRRYAPNGTGAKTGQGRPRIKKQAGRPTKHDPRFDEIAGNFARMGIATMKLLRN
ncbi:MAG: hypothetical protein K1000chlam3_00070 [Chlamydiae bacterium]|nr:hypothetical protein [Chlamydiota bacterium]